MRDARALKIAIELVVFTTPVGLNNLDFAIQEAFDMSLKVIEDLLNIRLMFKQINPNEARVIINKTDIILVPPTPPPPEDAIAGPQTSECINSRGTVVT